MRSSPVWTKTDWPSPKEWQMLLDPYTDELISQAYMDIQRDEILKEVKNEEGFESVNTFRNRCAVALSEAARD